MTGLIGKAPFWLDPDDPDTHFPDVELALTEPDGLLAIGGDLTVARLLDAYRQGIFPWYGQGQPILWWSPDPRLVLFPDALRISRSLRKTLRRRRFEVTMDRDFAAVISACAGPRAGKDGTWITRAMQTAYIRLHQSGHAHSVECRLDGELAGGLYGVAIGRVFFGESMFARTSDASKVAFVWLVRQLQRWGFRLIDCQIHTRHLASLGARDLPRRQFSRMLAEDCRLTPPPAWVFDPDLEVL
jgi:leucyl/phenylalanyl-tRNA--protein transferase